MRLLTTVVLLAGCFDFSSLATLYRADLGMDDLAAVEDLAAVDFAGSDLAGGADLATKSDLGLPKLAFEAALSITVNPSPIAVAVGRLHGGDTLDDIAVLSRSANTIVVVDNQPLGAYSIRTPPAPGGSGIYGLAIADWDGDTVNDLVASQETAGILIWWRNLGDTTYASSANLSVGNGRVPRGVIGADFDNDGKIDLAFADAGAVATSLVVVFNDGGGMMGPIVNLPIDFAPTEILAAHLDMDGQLDLVGLGGAARKFVPALASGTRAFAVGTPTIVENNGTSVGMATGLLDQDGNVDLVVAESTVEDAHVYLGHGDGSFDPPIVHNSNEGPRGVGIADFNRDGFLDVAIANNVTPNGKVSVLLGRGDGTLAAAVQFAAGADPWGLAVGDFDGNGRPDIVVTNHGDGTISILKNLTN
jgi:hypothetical protein